MHKTEEKNTSESLFQAFVAYLEANSSRRTPERLMVLQSACDAEAPFGVDSLCEHLEAGNHHVARATVYSTLRLLVDSGILREAVMPGCREKRYELSSPAQMHTVCRRCGKLKPLRDAELEALLKSRRFRGVNSEYFSLTVYGICSSCARKKTRKKPKHEKYNR